MARKTTLEYPAVYIFHKECDGWWYMGVDMPGNKRDVKDAIYRASVAGDRVERYGPNERPPIGSACTCKWPEWAQ